MYSNTLARYSTSVVLLFVVSIVSGQLKSPRNFVDSKQQQQLLQPFQQQALDFGAIRQQQRQQMQQQQQQQPQMSQATPQQQQLQQPLQQQQQQQRPESQLVSIKSQQKQQVPMKSRQLTVVQPLIGEGIRVTLSEPTSGYARLENMIGFLDRIAYAVSKPATLVNVVRFITLALSSLVMSSFIFPTSTLFDFSKKRNRERFQRYNPFNYINRQDIENVIDLMSTNYDDALNRAGLMEKSSCRERSLCVLGDMVSCEFPSVVVSVGKFAQNNLPPIDVQKNKYSKALMMGFNQTDCNQAFKLNDFECPTFRDYVRSYFHGGARRRRDNHWRKH